MQKLRAGRKATEAGHLADSKGGSPLLPREGGGALGHPNNPRGGGSRALDFEPGEGGSDPQPGRYSGGGVNKKQPASRRGEYDFLLN
jgi:hypothetical protein